MNKKYKVDIECTECKHVYKRWPYQIKGFAGAFICKSCRTLGTEKVKCQHCKKVFISPKRDNRKFCSHSCSAKVSNIGREHSKEQKEKLSRSLKLFYKLNPERKRSVSGWFHNRCKIHIVKCKNCNANFVRANAKGNINWKTCSRDCAIHLSVGNRTYQNGSRKPVWYYNKHQDKKVLLESSWEVKTAKKLDDLKIDWIRPEPLKWLNNKKTRYYFPDFYLPKFDLYLDPKNPYCMERDKDKMLYFEKKISIVYGDINKILDMVESLI